MTFNRRWIASLVAGWLLVGSSALAQEEGASSGFGSSGSGASSGFGLPLPSGGATSDGTGFSSGSTSAPTSSGSVFSPGTGSSSSFGDTTTSPYAPSTTPATPGVPGLGPTGTTPPASGVPGASSSFGPPGDLSGPSIQDSAPTSFTLSGAYGQAAQTFTLGEGRLARPRFNYSATLSLGYDDNILQTPTISEGIPEIRQEVLVDPGVPEPVFEQVPVFRTVTRIINGNFVQVQVPTGETRLVLVEPARPPEFEEVVVQEEIPAQERIGSFFARAAANYEIQIGTRRTVFTMDLRGNADYYFDRPTDQTDLNGSLAFNYIHRITPRLQFSASVNLAYLSQPDVRRLNTPTRQVGDYINGTSKFDLSYRWTRRFTTVTSLSLNTLYYMEELQQAANFYETLFGTEARYLWSPRLTVLGEVRYGFSVYPDNPLVESNTIYGLLGAEYLFSARLSTSLRAGGSRRTFSESGESSITPYAEATASWRLFPTTFVSWNSRFGFEEPPDANSQVQSLRSGLSVITAFSARLRGSVGLTYVNRKTTSTLNDAEFTEETVDANLGLQYQWSRRLSLSASYSFTNVFSSSEVSDYYRNRIFFGAEYSF